MAGKNVKGRSASGPPFVQLFHYMLKTDAWQSLTPQDRAVFVELVRLYNGSNNGFIALSARDAADRSNISKNTVTECFRRLCERGFIELAQPGGFHGAALAAEWRLTHQRCDRTGRAPSKAFQAYRFNAAERKREDARDKARKRTREQRRERKSRSQMRDASVPNEGHRDMRAGVSVPNETTDRAVSFKASVPNEGTHIHLAIGSAPEGLLCCISDDAREARPPKGAVASERRRGSRPTTFPN